MDAIHSQVFRWDDEEMSGYPFLCQSQKPLPNTALADTGRLLARQTLVCVSRSSKYLHLIPKGSIDSSQLPLQTRGTIVTIGH